VGIEGNQQRIIVHVDAFFKDEIRVGVPGIKIRPFQILSHGDRLAQQHLLHNKSYNSKRTLIALSEIRTVLHRQF
jgi:hypothetical protein